MVCSSFRRFLYCYWCVLLSRHFFIVTGVLLIRDISFSYLECSIVPEHFFLVLGVFYNFGTFLYRTWSVFFSFGTFVCVCVCVVTGVCYSSIASEHFFVVIRVLSEHFFIVA